ncbi:MAG: hypothetical protein H8E85_05845 [Candidatus Marinimicrobia bacterium]|nr:hypothetical protein [Candidatus Neomarinimicrobiota bacterium]
MELKDKLDLIWKYLLLLVLVVGMCSHLCHRGCGKYRCGGKGTKACWRTQHNFDPQSEIQDIQIQMEVEGNDTLLKVVVNGVELPEDEANAILKKKEEIGMRGIVKKTK